jgi:hypothetical protein
MGAIAAVVVVSATACDKDKTADAGDKAAAPAVVEVPARKPGLWRQTMLVEGIDMIQTVELCLDKASDGKLAWWGQQGFKQACSKNEIKHQADGSWTFSSVCEGAGVKTTNDGSAVGDFSSKYQIKADSTTTGAPVPEMNGSRTITIDAEWLGECAAGMKPGDMDLPNGQRINMLEVSGLQ